MTRGFVLQKLASLSGLGVILAAYVATSLAWSVALPLWQGTDEAAHFGLMQYIAETGRLPGAAQRYRSDEIVLAGELSDVSRLPWDPTQRQAFAPGAVGLREGEIQALDPELRTSFERKAADQVMLVPPLYGGLGALIYRLRYDRDIIERAFAIRAYAICIGGAILLFAYLLARELWPRRGHLWATLLVLVAFQPQFMYSAAGGTSDLLAMLWFTVLAYLMVRTVRRGIGYGLAASMGLSLGLGLLTKPHLFLTGPAMATLLVYLWVTEQGNRRRVLACGAIVAGLGLLLWLPWAIRSVRLHGNPFYDTLWAGGWATVSDPQYDYPLGRYVRDYLLSLGGGLFASYWGVFGYLDTPLDPAYYRVLQVLTLLAVGGLALKAWRVVADRRLARRHISYVLLAVLALTPMIYLGIFDYRMWRQAGIGWPLMGRHFAGPLVAQLALWAWGLLAWLPRRVRPLGHLAARAGMIALNYVGLLAYLLPRYYR